MVADCNPHQVRDLVHCKRRSARYEPRPTLALRRARCGLLSAASRMASKGRLASQQGAAAASLAAAMVCAPPWCTRVIATLISPNRPCAPPWCTRGSMTHMRLSPTAPDGTRLCLTAYLTECLTTCLADRVPLQARCATGTACRPSIRVSGPLMSCDSSRAST